MHGSPLFHPSLRTPDLCLGWMPRTAVTLRPRGSDSATLPCHTNVVFVFFPLGTPSTVGAAGVWACGPNLKLREAKRGEFAPVSHELMGGLTHTAWVGLSAH